MRVESSPPDTWSQVGAERKLLFPEPEEGQQQPRMALGFETLDDWPVVTPGRSHGQNNGVFLKTSPVSSLLRAGSSDFLSLAWDLLSFLCQQLSPSPARRTAPSEASQVAKAVFHTHLSEACPELSQGCQQPSWSPASCLPAGDTGAAQRFPAPVQSPRCSCSSWSPGGGSNGPAVW